LAVFVIFLFISVVLHLKVRNNVDDGEDKRWTNIFFVVYLNMTCLSVRALYRVAEFAQTNYHSKLSTNEAYFYSLDVLLMIILMASWIPFHPSRFGMKKEKGVTPACNTCTPTPDATPDGSDATSVVKSMA
jgi:RTA1 like protein